MRLSLQPLLSLSLVIGQALVSQTPVVDIGECVQQPYVDRV